MAAVTWNNDAGNNNGNDPDNWVEDRVPTGTDVATWDATSVANCTFSGALSCAGINVTAAYSGVIDFNDQTISTTGDQTYDGTGEIKCGSGTITCTGNLDYKDQTTWSKETASWILNGTGKTITSIVGTRRVYNLTIDGTITNSVGRVQVSNGWVINTGKSLTIGTSFGQLYSGGTLWGTLTINAGAFVFSGGNVYFKSGSIVNGTHKPNFDFTTIQEMEGTFTLGATTRYVITLAGGTYTGDWSFARGNIARTVTFGTGGFQTLTFTGDVDFDDGGGTYTLDLDTHDPDAVFQGDLTLVETGTLNWSKGTGTVSFTGSSNQELTSLDKNLGTVEVEKTGGIFKLMDETTFDSFLAGGSADGGEIDFNGQTLDTTGNLTIDTLANVVSDADAMNGATLNVGGDLDLNGQNGDPLLLNATAGWTLNVSGAADADWTDVAHSNATGTEIDATFNCTDNNNNTNWDFGAADIPHYYYAQEQAAAL